MGPLSLSFPCAAGANERSSGRTTYNSVIQSNLALSHLSTRIDSTRETGPLFECVCKEIVETCEIGLWRIESKYE